MLHSLKLLIVRFSVTYLVWYFSCEYLSIILPDDIIFFVTAEICHWLDDVIIGKYTF